MKATTSAILFAGAASATLSGGWTGAPSFKTPITNNNQCSDQEKQGYSWGNLQLGSFSSYDGFSFSGFQCANSFGKRDPLSKRTFGGKVIQGQVDTSSGPSFSCSQNKDFSIKEYQVSVSKDTDVEFHYTMDDGSTCKHTSSCRSGGSVVQNSQCGGAKQVTFKLPTGSGSGCQIGIHSIGFDCSPPPSSSTPPKSSSTPSLPTTSSVPVVPSSSKPESSYAVPSSSSTPAGPSVPSSSSSTPSTSSYSIPSSSYAVPSSSSTPDSPKTPSSSSIPVVPSSYGVPSSSYSVPIPSSSTPGSPVTSSSSSVPVPSSSVPVPSSSKPSPPAPSAPCPDVLPQCLNTWLHQTECKDNSDVDCYCKKAEFTKNVIQCVSSYGIDTTEIQKALSYFIGICAAYVPQNPGLITNCPSSIPLTGASHAPTPSSTPNSPVTVSSSSTPDVPSVVLTTVVVSTSVTTCPAGQTVTNAGQTTVLPTPSVSTIYVTSTSTICTKCAAPPASTPAAPVSSAPGIPYTTITVAQTYTVPCTYSTGVSIGYPIPSSSTVTTLSTSVVVPQVQFTTAAPVGGSTVSVGLAQGPPTQAPGAPTTAGTTPVYPTTGILTAPGGFGTTYVPSKSASGSVVMQTVNAAPRLGSGPVVGLLAGGAFAMFAL